MERHYDCATIEKSSMWRKWKSCLTSLVQRLREAPIQPTKCLASSMESTFAEKLEHERVCRTLLQYQGSRTPPTPSAIWVADPLWWRHRLLRLRKIQLLRFDHDSMDTGVAFLRSKSSSEYTNCYDVNYSAVFNTAVEIVTSWWKSKGPP